MKKIYLLIDFENIQKIDTTIIKEMDVSVKIFVGNSQNQLPFEMVQELQPLAEKIDWIKIAGNGKNNLDFHITYYLGVLTKDVNNVMVILSKDTGYDNLIKYINDKNQRNVCLRINDITKLEKVKFNESDLGINLEEKKSTPAAKIPEIVQFIKFNLSKINKLKRPRKIKSFMSHIKFLCKNKYRVTEPIILECIEEMISDESIVVDNNNIKYNF